MSAPQTSTILNKRALTFSGVLANTLRDAGHHVIQCEPDVTWERYDLEHNDVVLVGISPLTSVTANHAYGALNIIERMASSDKLRLFIDAPRPSQITASLRAIDSKPEDLTKEFYTNRKGYQHALAEENTERFMRVVKFLLNEDWPDTIFPMLPWQQISDIASQLPAGAGSYLKGVNLDSLLAKSVKRNSSTRGTRWVAEMPESNWTGKVAKTLENPIVPMKEHKGLADEDIEDAIHESLGSLIGPYREGTWWSYRYIQSLNSMTPIATDWKESSSIGQAWNVLAPTIESMSQSERDLLSTMQRIEYLDKVPTKQQALSSLEDLLGLQAKGKVTA
jgi:hypothetical protein